MMRVSRCGAAIGGAPERRNAVHLGPVRGGERRVVGAQELAADREAAEPLDLVDAGLLQQRQRVTACPDEHEFRVQPALFAGAPVAHRSRVQLPSDSLATGCGPRGRTAWSCRARARSR